MKKGGGRPRIVVHAADPRVRSLIIRRLAAAGDLDVVADGAGPTQDAGALVEADAAGPQGPDGGQGSYDGQGSYGAQGSYGVQGPDGRPDPEGLPGGAVTLTPREAEVLALMADGMANKEIGSRLSISTHTAKFHVESIFRKLSAANRAEAVREGIRRGLIVV